MTILDTIIIRDQDGNELFTFNPCPSASFNSSNTGQNAKTPVTARRPTISRSNVKTNTISIKAVLLGSEWSGMTVIDQLSELEYIMDGAAAEYLILQIPVCTEIMAGTPKTYSGSDSAKDNARYSTGENYIQAYVSPSGMSLDSIRMVSDIAYITLSFVEVDSVVSLL